MKENLNLAKIDKINLPNGKVIRTKKIGLCNWCHAPLPLSNLIKCSGFKCEKKICKNCCTFIDDKPFCNSCVIDIVNNKSVLIVTRGEL